MISSDQRTCIGYLCGTVIMLMMLYKDGEVALATAAASVLTMFGVQAYTNAKAKALRPKNSP